MSRALSKPKVRRRPSLPLRRWITRTEFEALMEAGVFPREERLELLAGELTRREPVNTAHAVAVVLVSEALQQVLPKNLHLRTQLPLALSDYDEPFPDLAVVSGSPRDYLAQHPTSALLVVEVSEASLKTDREVKGSLYASAGIPEYWILNLRERVLEVYREPAADARAVYGAAYRQQRIYTTGEPVSPLCAPDATLAVEQLLP
jgi:Uma2 family endonuclease